MAFEQRVLGATGLTVSPVGIGGGYGCPPGLIERAFDRGINYYFYGTWIPTYRKMEAGMRHLLQEHRDEVVLASGAYFWLHHSRLEGVVTKHLKRLKIDYIDVFHLSWIMRESQDRAVEEALRLKDKGLIRHLAISGHRRKLLRELSQKWPVETIMLRYNAAHPGAERDIFDHLPEKDRPGVVAFNALKHGQMLKRPRGWGRSKPLPTAIQCYRFALSHPSVDVCLAGITNQQELAELLMVVEDGPLSDDEMSFMREFGKIRHG